MSQPLLLTRHKKCLVDSPVQPMSEDVQPDSEIPQQPVEDQAMDDLQKAIEVPVPDDDEDLMVSGSSKVPNGHVLEVSMNVTQDDITDNPLSLSEVLVFDGHPKS